jgi:DNA-directed RNA polymerase subunit M
MITEKGMEFCPKCGSILMVKKSRLCCPRCEYSKKGCDNLIIKESINEKKEICVIDEKEENVNPKIDFKCEKCGCGKAYFWLQQMRAGDEPESKFYECIKCKNVVRVD